MLSRLAYLLKYTSDSNKKEKKKKDKKRKEKDTLIVSYQKPFTNGNDDDEEVEAEILEEGEGAPAQIEVSREFKGFRRIDNQQLVQDTASEAKDEEPLQQQETIYRDISGRKIDIAEKREEVRLKREKEASEEAKYSEYIKNDESLVSYKVEKKRLNEYFDDPFKLAPMLKEDALGYKGINVPNRFGVTAGILWDGIDRSNGFEQLLMKKRQEQKVSRLDLKNNEEYNFD